MCFAEIGEYANEGYTVFCENIHAVIACWCFIMLDLLCIFVQFALFFLLPEKHSERHIAEWALLGWMSLSAALYITGPIGLGYEKTCMFRIYKWRVFLSMFRSLSSLGFYAWRTRIILCILWSYCFVTYAVGFHICRYTLHYIKDHYRGYDDVDPERVAEFERVMQDAIDVANKPKKQPTKRPSPKPSRKEESKKK